MAIDPARRYASTDAFSEDLQRYLSHQPIQAQRISRWQRARKFVRRHRQGVAVACLLLAALGAGVGGVLWQAQRAAEEARRASAIKDFLVEIFAANDPRIASDQPRGSITAKALLDAGAAKIESRFANDPDVQIELLRTVADLYAQLGEDERYEAMQALQLKKVRERYGPLHPNILNGAVEASVRACNAGDAPRCEATLVEADRLLSAAGDEDPELRAYWWISRGQHLQRQDGRLDDARHAFERAVALFGKHASRSRGHVTALHELAGFLNAQQQDHARAIATYHLPPGAGARRIAAGQERCRIADALLQSRSGPPATRPIRGSRGRVRKSADIADRTTGAEFPTAWAPRANAARTLHLIGQREAAHLEFKRLLPLLPGDGSHPLETATVRLHYGERMASEGQAAAGIEGLEAVERTYAQQSAFSFQLRLSRRFLGEAYARAGRNDDAGRMLKASLDDYLAHQQNREQAVMAIRESWGRWLLDNGRLDEAQTQFSTIVDHADGRTLAHVALAHGGLARVALARHDRAVTWRESAAAMETWNNVAGFRDVRMGPYLQRIRADVLAAGGEVAAAQTLEDEATAASARYDHPDSPTVVRRRMAARQ